MGIPTTPWICSLGEPPHLPTTNCVALCSVPNSFLDLLYSVPHSSLVRVLQATLRRGADGSTRCGTPATPRSTSRSLRRCRSTSRPLGSRSSSTSTSSSPSSRLEPGSSSRTSTTSASSVSHVVLIINEERIFNKSRDSKVLWHLYQCLHHIWPNVVEPIFGVTCFIYSKPKQFIQGDIISDIAVLTLMSSVNKPSNRLSSALEGLYITVSYSRRHWKMGSCSC